MEFIKQKNFNDEMGRYLDGKKKGGSASVLSKLKMKKTSFEEEVPDLSETRVHIEYKEPSFIQRVMQWRRKFKLKEAEEDLTEDEKKKLEDMEGEIEALEEEEGDLEELEEEIEERKAGLLKTFFQKLGFFKEGEYFDEDYEGFEEEAMVPEMAEDVKEVLKICHTWLEKLPVRSKKSFKESKDFEKYKSILIKYGLVREK